jgi:cell wall-associated NlpC family hydrolase
MPVDARSSAIRSRFARAGAVIAALLAVTALVATAGTARAAPGPTISQVRHRLTQLKSQEDRAIQFYDQAVQSLAAARRRLVVAQRQVSKAHAELAAMHTQIAQIAAVAYETRTLNPTSFGALLTNPDPQAALSEVPLLQHLSSNRAGELTQVLAAARRYAAAQRAARRIKAAVAALAQRRLTQRQAVAATITRQKALLRRLTAQQRAALRRQAARSAAGTTTATYTGPTTTQAGKAVAFAYAQLGKPYVWGATGPASYDCSGLVEAAWASAGVAIPRTTYEQWAALPHVPMSAIQPGDLIFFDAIGHVAIYVGNNMIIDAPQPGQFVEKISLSTPWYATTLDGAARP